MPKESKTDPVEAYPLQWPSHLARTKKPKRSRFKSGRSASDGRSKFVTAVRGIQTELSRHGAKNIIVSSNVPLRKDGLPRASFRSPDDRGIAVYFFVNGDTSVIACDAWLSVTENLHAIYLSLQSIRGLERWGCTDIMKSAFAGLKALPESATPSSWRQILGVSESASYEEVKATWRTRAKEASGDELYVVNDAWQSAKREFMTEARR